MKKSSQKKFRLRSWQTVELFIAVLLIVGTLIFGYYWFFMRGVVYTDKAQIYATLIKISPEQPGVLKQLLVNEGDTVTANQAVARVDNAYLTTKTVGIITTVDNSIGTLFFPGTPVVTMINPNDLRVVARVEETNGFTSIHVGDPTTFTVDAFGSKKFKGTVSEIAKTAYRPSVAFSISDKRPTQEFEVKIKFNPKQYPELLNGMSARVWINTK